ncbi:MAG: FAD-dependent oxidoreductase, partial [Alphaproteobacteria bacterium]|nr:FAD-dependent oxidoreductase [Alphaproteobacteria bacterium]
MPKTENAGCYWWEEAPPRPAPEQPWQKNAEIVVIGAGFAGLAAALVLARAKKDVVVIEKGLIGEGASTRNGGITSGNIRHSFSDLTRRFGEERAQAFEDEAV